MSFESFSLSSTINWIAVQHGDQLRKGTEIPYVAHVFGVTSLLMTHGIVKKEILIAALLHDAVEDTSVTLEQTRETFGDEIASMVAMLSEDKTKGWEERKQTAIDHIATLPLEVKWIKLADKVNSLEMMTSEIEEGTMNWDKFNRGYDSQKWFYTTIFAELEKDEQIRESSLYLLGKSLLHRVFG